VKLRSSVLTGAILIAGLAACGDDSATTSSVAVTSPSTEGSSVAETTAISASDGDMSLTIGYSAWPGWFPLAVAEEQGFFKAAGLDVKLTYFVDYTASLDALVAEKLDVNAQTLNDTIFAVASGADQRIVITGDNSTGNDAVICDKSINTIDDLKGKTIAAEAGVVDHFLLLQGLATKNLTEADIVFKGVKTDAAAAGFAGGQFDCAAVFAPFTAQALGRAGSHVVFSSKDFPGSIPDHLVATAGAAAGKPKAMAALVKAWYATLDWIKANPADATAIMAAKAEITPTEYGAFAEGTTLFDAPTALKAFEDRAGDPTSLPEMARRINPFLVSSGLAEKEADLSKMLDASFTKAYVDGAGGG
jgi:NitT/TauT family transport system substrate-binding protein